MRMAGSARRFPLARRKTRRKRTGAFDTAHASGGRSAIARDRGALARRIAGACRHALEPHLHRRLQRAHCRVRCRRSSRRSCPLDRRHPCACRASVSAAATPARFPAGCLPQSTCGAIDEAVRLRPTRSAAHHRQSFFRRWQGVGHRLRGLFPAHALPRLHAQLGPQRPRCQCGEVVGHQIIST